MRVATTNVCVLMNCLPRPRSLAWHPLRLASHQERRARRSLTLMRPFVGLPLSTSIDVPMALSAALGSPTPSVYF